MRVPSRAVMMDSAGCCRRYAAAPDDFGPGLTRLRIWLAVDVLSAALPVLDDLVGERVRMPPLVVKPPRVAFAAYLATRPGSHHCRPANTGGVWERRRDDPGLS